jgi:hypothetical protein
VKIKLKKLEKNKMKEEEGLLYRKVKGEIWFVKGRGKRGEGERDNNGIF